MEIYDMEEYMKSYEAQAKKDKVLMRSCIQGLTIYALQYQREHGMEASSDKVNKIRGMIVEISEYWALDEFFQMDAKKHFLDLFDRRMKEPSQLLYTQPPLTAGSTLEGLYRYAMEIVICQGIDLEDDILRNKDLIKEIAAFWHCESPVVDQMCNQIEKALHRMSESSLKSQPQGFDMKL